MAQLPGGGVDDGLGDEIGRARWQLWAAKAEQSGSIRAAGGYVVDPEKAQGCVDELTRIANDVRRTLLETRGLYFDPPGFDEVSVNVARNGAVMAARCESYIRAWAGQIEATRDALQRQLDDYREVEQINAGRRL